MHLQVSHSIRPAPVATARAAVSTPVRDALRNASHAVHMRMHGLEPFQAILEGRLPLNDYLALVQSQRMFHSAIAAGAARWGCASLSSSMRRLELLRADIRSLGGGHFEHSIDWRPRTPGEVLGALYAAEGSMLGGRVIFSQLDYLFGSAPEGRSFYKGTSDDGANWHKLLSVLELRCRAPKDRDEAIRGALFGFDLFEHCLIQDRRCAGPNRRGVMAR